MKPTYYHTLLGFVAARWRRLLIRLVFLPLTCVYVLALADAVIRLARFWLSPHVWDGPVYAAGPSAVYLLLAADVFGWAALATGSLFPAREGARAAWQWGWMLLLSLFLGTAFNMGTGLYPFAACDPRGWPFGCSVGLSLGAAVLCAAALGALRLPVAARKYARWGFPCALAVYVTAVYIIY